MEEYVDHHLSLAEDASLLQLQSEVGRFTNKRDPSGLIHSAWHHIELAMNHDKQFSDDFRKINIDLSQYLLGASIRATSDPIQGSESIDYTENNYYDALQLSSYTPLFAKRAYQQELTRDDVDGLYSSLGVVLGARLSSNGSPNISENLVYALSARTRNPAYVVYPTSPREESSAYYPINHDGYFLQPELDKRYKKLPVQMKLGATALKYDSPVVVMVISELLKSAGCRQVERAADNPHELASFVNGVAEQVVKESKGDKLNDIDTRVLNTATRSLVNYYRQADKTRARYDMAS